MKTYEAKSTTRPGAIVPHYTVEAGYLRLSFHDGVREGQPKQPGNCWAAKLLGGDALYLYRLDRKAGALYGILQPWYGGLTPEGVMSAVGNPGFKFGGQLGGDGVIFDNLWRDCCAIERAAA